MKKKKGKRKRKRKEKKKKKKEKKEKRKEGREERKHLKAESAAACRALVEKGEKRGKDACVRKNTERGAELTLHRRQKRLNARRAEKREKS